MLFSDFSKHLSTIEGTTKRLEMTASLVKLFQELDKDEVRPVCYLMQGKLVPKYESKEFQLSDKMIIRILARVIDRSALQTSAQSVLDAEADFSTQEKEITSLYKKLGDLGTVAEQVQQRKGTSLDVRTVFNKLHEVADDNGQGSQERKVQKMVDLLSLLDPLSSRYVVRIVIGKLRLGFSDMTIIDALSWYLTGDKSLSSEIEDAYQKRVDIGYIAHLLLTKDISALQSVKVKVGTPIIPALCQRLNTAEEMIEKMSEVFAEPKYDGTRVQIHFDRKNNLIRTYTRNLEDSTHMFPELVEAVKNLNCDSCILDSEAIGYDSKTGQLLPFQQTIQRKRKHGIEEFAKSLPLRFYIFDVLEKDGTSLIDQPLDQRKEVLNSLFTTNDIFVQSPFIRTIDATELHDYHEKQLSLGLEGVVTKMAKGVYQSGRKGYSWVKIKETEGSRGKLSDTVDCVVMGYFVARGNRSEFLVGAVLAGILNANGEIVTISKVGSGFSEDLAKEFMKRAEPLIISDKPNLYQVSKNLTPDVWLQPGVVIEVAADEITISPSHTAGFALRFPRLIKFRDDKGWEQITTVEEMKQISKGSLDVINGA